jgi:hypothetical protein
MKCLRSGIKYRNKLSQCPPEFLLRPEPLVNNTENFTASHIPNQAELNKIMKIIKCKMIRDYDLPFEARQFRIEQQASPVTAVR